MDYEESATVGYDSAAYRRWTAPAMPGTRLCWAACDWDILRVFIGRRYEVGVLLCGTCVGQGGDCHSNARLLPHWGNGASKSAYFGSIWASPSRISHKSLLVEMWNRSINDFAGTSRCSGS